jgi:hypothetical protein
MDSAFNDDDMAKGRSLTMVMMVMKMAMMLLPRTPTTARGAGRDADRDAAASSKDVHHREWTRPRRRPRRCCFLQGRPLLRGEPAATPTTTLLLPPSMSTTASGHGRDADRDAAASSKDAHYCEGSRPPNRET